MAYDHPTPPESRPVHGRADGRPDLGAARAQEIDELRARAPRRGRRAASLGQTTGAVVVSHRERSVAVTESALIYRGENGARHLFVPRRDVDADLVTPSERQGYEPPFGQVRLWRIALPDGRVIDNVGYSIDAPPSRFQALANHICFFADHADAAVVVDEVL